MQGLAQVPASIPAARGKNTPSVRHDLWKRAHLIPSFNISLKLFMGLSAALRSKARQDLRARALTVCPPHHPSTLTTRTH